MPMVGFGTYKLKESDKGVVSSALRAGYRLVDTAHVYAGGKMEGVVGKAIKNREVFVTTKHWRGFHGYDATRQCLAQSLGRLGVDAVDLYLMHWPGPGYSAMARSKNRSIESYFKKGHEDMASLRLETWRAMEDAYLSGKCRAIGVSNFTCDHLRKLLAWPDLRVRPTVNQIELHPYLQQRDLVFLCEKENVKLQAYASLGGQDSSAKDWAALGMPPLLDHPAVLAAAEAHGATPAAVLLRWALQHGYAIIPKSRSPDRIAHNAAALDRFDLSDAEMAALDALDLGGMNGRLTWRRDELRALDFE
ncbi:hypothetical protein CTAYLR_001577 [Chrysophaeum taylorii]|uniref:NADP-dependent oxidoreductase domain-containing protein n=1 Tax=Chrysophaeum taylorii TaxID=2483200 RepID=A0AAD7UE40_9STRA|nr:hypothetical protein CTAYLR_001577 [Chrysophaeum taylorii]